MQSRKRKYRKQKSSRLVLREAKKMVECLGSSDGIGLGQGGLSESYGCGQRMRASGETGTICMRRAREMEPGFGSWVSSLPGDIRRSLDRGAYGQGREEGFDRVPEEADDYVPFSSAV